MLMKLAAAIAGRPRHAVTDARHSDRIASAGEWCSQLQGAAAGACAATFPRRGQCNEQLRPS